MDTPLLRRRVLDRQVEDSTLTSPAPWGAWVWLGPILTLLAVIVVAKLIGHQLYPHGSAAAVAAAAIGIIGDALLLAALMTFGRAAAVRGGGWRATFGITSAWDGDGKPWLAGVVIAYAARLVIGLVANQLTGGKAAEEAKNLRLHHLDGLGLWLLLVALVLVAPVVEEFMFRGLLLRAFMRRMPFWPAAWLSSILFGAFHPYEVSTLAGAITLAASSGALGLTNCVLVRVTGRLTPGILVHATSNLVAVLFLAHLANR